MSVFMNDHPFLFTILCILALCVVESCVLAIARRR
jgi:hypothetical protein